MNRLASALSLYVCLLGYSLSAKSIHEAYSIKAGKIQQWIKIDGYDEKNPVLLFLHGGPGNSAISYASKFTKELQKKFIVVLWDQRESGKTKDLNHSAEPLTVELFESDAVEVINYLREKFHQPKIYLAGHSWGGFLALQIASHHAELLQACFAAAPMVHQVASEQLALDKMKELATEKNNREALTELAEIKIPFENGRQLFLHRKWLLTLLHHDQVRFSLSYVEDWAQTWLTMFNKASQIDFAITAPEIACSVFFLIGANDYQTNFTLTKNYFDLLKAPKKELFWFKQSAHSLNLTEPGRFQEVIISSMEAKP